MMNVDPFGARSTLETAAGPLGYYRLGKLAEEGLADLGRVPLTVRVLLENVLRGAGSGAVTEDDVTALAGWSAAADTEREVPFSPARVLLQDFTGVPAVVDLAAMRAEMARTGADPGRVDPLVPVDIVIDHSVQVDVFGTPDALARNAALEYARNGERYELLRWAQQAFRGFRAVPPGMGIVHQVNLEHLARVVCLLDGGPEGPVAVPDTLVGTDSHTPMVNGLGVLGWGVGGIEAEAAMLGQPIPLATPKVVGVRLTGELAAGVTATDLVLTITELLRRHGVVGKFVEFHGVGLAGLSVPDRATLSNMTPEYGATACLWPVDGRTLDYLRLTGRPEDLVDLVERYTKAQGLFHTADCPVPEYSEEAGLDLATVEPSLAGPNRPQDRVALARLGESFRAAFADEVAPKEVGEMVSEGGRPGGTFPPNPDPAAAGEVHGNGLQEIHHGAVVIAAITSCTNTSNPSVMVAAGLLARKAVERGLARRPWVKTSLAPGSQVVTDYLAGAGLLPYLEKLGFDVVGYGCTTCIGNSGPLPDDVAAAVESRGLAVAAVLSGNRNFEGRIHPLVRAAYLASPPLVVAYALAGRVDVDLTTEPVAVTPGGEAVMLADLWPTPEEIVEAMQAVEAERYRRVYATVFDGDEHWRTLPSPTGASYAWDADSTYVQEPPFFRDLGEVPSPLSDVAGARCLALLGDSVTTDHISPAGTIQADSPAGRYLVAHGVAGTDFNSYGSRRGNHEVMMRGTFANIRLRNRLVGERVGGWTVHLPDGEETTVFDAAMRYRDEGVPLVVLAGKEYGSGSSRDWAAKGTLLLGVRAVLAEGYERIHRSNLVGMGVLPLELPAGESAASLGLTGREVFYVGGIATGLAPRALLPVRATAEDGAVAEFEVRCRIDSPVELEYYRHGGVLQYVLRRMRAQGRAGSPSRDV